MIVEEQEREGDLIDAAAILVEIGGDHQILPRIMVEIGLPHGGVPEPLRDRQNRTPPFGIVVMTLEKDAVAVPYHLEPAELY
jgi:hypothetical protein